MTWKTENGWLIFWYVQTKGYPSSVKKEYLAFCTGHLLADQDQFLQLPDAEEKKIL